MNLTNPTWIYITNLDNVSSSSRDLIPTKNSAVGIYLLFIGENIKTLFIPSCRLLILSVLVSFFSNLLVVAVIMLRPKKISSTDVFIIALAASDMLFALCIHPMLIATSFGADVSVLFSTAGIYLLFLKVH